MEQFQFQIGDPFVYQNWAIVYFTMQNFSPGFEMSVKSGAEPKPYSFATLFANRVVIEL